MSEVIKSFPDSVIEMSEDQLEKYIGTCQRVMYILKDQGKVKEYQQVYLEYISDLQKLKEAGMITAEDYDDLEREAR